MKIKVSKFSDSTQKELDRISEIQLGKLKAFIDSAPFSTPLYAAMKTKIPLTFVLKHREELGI